MAIPQRRSLNAIAPLTVSLSCGATDGAPWVVKPQLKIYSSTPAAPQCDRRYRTNIAKCEDDEDNHTYMVSVKLSLYTGIWMVMWGRFVSTSLFGAGLTAE